MVYNPTIQPKTKESWASVSREIKRIEGKMKSNIARLDPKRDLTS